MGGVLQGRGLHVAGVSPVRAWVPVARGAGRDPELQPPPLPPAGARDRAVGLTGSVPAAASPGALAARRDPRSPRGRENGPGPSASPGPGGQVSAREQPPGPGAETRGSACPRVTVSAPQGKAPRTQPSPGPAGWWRSRPRAPLEEIQLGAGGQKKVPESSAASKGIGAGCYPGTPGAATQAKQGVGPSAPVWAGRAGGLMSCFWGCPQSPAPCMELRLPGATPGPTRRVIALASPLRASNASSRPGRGGGPEPSLVLPPADASAVEFVADPAALAGILSNVRLCSPVLGPGGKPSLARRIPLRGSRSNSLLAQGNTKVSPCQSPLSPCCPAGTGSWRLG